MKKYMIILMLILCMISVHADWTSPLKDSVNSATDGITGFTSDLTSDDYNVVYEAYPRTTTRGGVPVIADLDNDGVNEIVYHDGDSIAVFHVDGNDLQLIDDAETGGDIKSGLLLTDFDADGDKEIIFGTGTNITEYEFINNTLIKDNTFRSTSGDYSSGEVYIGCRSSTDCLMVRSKYSSRDFSTNNPITATPFDSSGINDSAQYTVATVPSSDYFFCPPDIKDMIVDDYDNDGVAEFVTSWLRVHNSGVDYIYFSIIEMSYTEPHTITSSTFYAPVYISTGDISSQNCGDGGHGSRITSPLLYDVTGSSKKEIAIGYMPDPDEYHVQVFDYSFNELMKCPTGFGTKADGEQISNLFISESNPDNENKDICMAGYSVTGTIDSTITCAGVEATDNSCAIFSIDTTDYENMTGHTYSTQAFTSSVYQAGNSIQQVATPYGITYLDYSSCPLIFGLCDTVISFSAPVDNTTSLFYDVQGTGYSDWLMFDHKGLYFADDGVSNTEPEIDEITLNPCFDQYALRENTTFSVTVKGLDIDNDQFQARIIAYSDDLTNRQDTGWSTLKNSGADYTGYFKANKTTVSGLVEVFVRSENSSLNDTEQIIFTVDTYGYVYGQTSCVLAYDTVLDPPDSVAGENAILTSLDSVDEGFNLNIGRSALFLLIMLVINAVILYQKSLSLSTGETALVLLMNVFALFLAVKLNILSVGILIGLAVFVVGGVFVYSRIFSRTGVN